MNLSAMISAMRFNRLTVLFLLLETALACAFVCNALFFIAHEAKPMLASTGIPHGQVLVVDGITSSYRFDPETRTMQGGITKAELQTLRERIRALPGVDAVATTLSLPYTSMRKKADQFQGSATGESVSVSQYNGIGLLDAWGLELLQGRNFKPTELVDFGAGYAQSNPQAAIITQDLALRLFPNGNAVGKRLYRTPLRSGQDAKPGPRIVGVVRAMPAYQPVVVDHLNASVLLSRVALGLPMVNLVVRTQADARDRVAAALPEVIARSIQLMPESHPRVRTFEMLHEDYFRSSRGKLSLLLGVTLAVVLITVIGIMGLTGFWVQRRRRTIGIRRALGATRRQILRHFLLENLLVVVPGVVLGAVAGWFGNAWLMAHLETAAMPFGWLLVGVVMLLILGQLAVLAPALRASRVPPVVATRSV